VKPNIDTYLVEAYSPFKSSLDDTLHRPALTPVKRMQDGVTAWRDLRRWLEPRDVENDPTLE
jgi:hypothetical protein